MAKVDNWEGHTLIGYVPLGEDGLPYQPTLGSGWRQRKKPVTVYKSHKTAVNYSPVDSAVEVRAFNLDLK